MRIKSQRTQIVIDVSGVDTTIPWKSMENCFAAFKKMHKRKDILELTLVGRENTLEYYKRKVKKYGLSLSVKYKIIENDIALAFVYRQKGIIVVPTSPDTLTYAIVLTGILSQEQAASVGSRIGSDPFTIRKGIYGLHINPKNSGQLSTSLFEILEVSNVNVPFLTPSQLEQTPSLHLSNIRKHLRKIPETKIQVVQLISYYPPHLGGAERVAEEISLELAKRGYPVQVITSRKNYSGHEEPQLIKNYTVHRLRGFEFAHTMFLPGLLTKLWRVKKPAVFHLHLTSAYFPELVWLVAKMRHIPYVVHFHLDIDPSGRLGSLFIIYKRYIHPIILRDAAHIITLSPEQADMVKRRYHLPEDKVSFLPNGVSKEYLTIGTKPREMHTPLRLLFVGRLSSQKRLDRLVEAMKLVHSNVALRIVGDGEKRHSLENLVNKLGLKNVTFSGALYGKECLDEYKEADLFVLPSEKEGMPLVLFEAMAAGLPVIGSNVQGIREHLSRVGIIVPNPSPTTFAAAIDEFYVHRKEQFPILSQASRAKAANYSWTRLTRQVEKLYKGLHVQSTKWTLRRPSLLLGVVGWWLAFLGLRHFPGLPSIFVNIVGFSFLVLVPGMLSVMCFRLRNLAPWGKLVLCLGFSLLELMLIGVIGNTVLQWFGIHRPLDTPYLIKEISLLLILLIIVTWLRTKDWELAIGEKLIELFPDRLNRLIAGIPLLFVSLSVLGATSLNNGGSDGWTMVMLIASAIYLLVLFYKSAKLTDAAIACGLFSISASLLLMTSLRGWYTTGHDIQVEYQVFQLALRQGVWQIQAFRNPYNSCLSITILPVIFANLLRVFDPYIFKVFFQLLFAFCPTILYLLVRKWATAAWAILATIYFIAFPTFFTDMPFLNRQEIAFIFFALMLYMIFQDELRLAFRRMLFLILGIGMILSHYSTTYSVIIILFIAVGAWPLIVKVGNRLAYYPAFSHSLLRSIQMKDHEIKRITLSMAVIIACGSFLWTSVLTNTGNSTLLVIQQTFDALQAGLEGQTLKSNDTSYSLFPSASVSPVAELKTYAKKVVAPARKKSPKLYYPAASFQQYPLKPTGDAIQPLTPLGNQLANHGFNITSFNFTFRQSTAKILQLLIIIGTVFILFKRPFSHLLDSDLIALAAGSILFVALQVFLPVLSAEYGLLRAFQQALLLLSLLIVLGSIALSAWLPTKLIKIGVPALLALLFFVSSTGVITQALGGYYAQLNLNNTGAYYDDYYTHKQELVAVTWLNILAQHTPKGVPGWNEVQLDQFTIGKLETYANQKLYLDDQIYPGLIIKNGYVFLGYANVTKQQAALSYNGDQITYSYPMKFLDTQKDLIYDNGGAEIYR